MLEYHSIALLVKQAIEQGVAISTLIIADQAEVMGKSPEELFNIMKRNLDIMRESAQKGMAQGIRSTSGLTGGDGWRMNEYVRKGAPLSGAFCASAIAQAIAIAEYNAAMGKIVAAPTAGSCGILPAAILTMIEHGANEKSAVMALFTAGAFGMVIMNEASIVGAEGGCQAECGSAAALAAAALVEMAGGAPDIVAHAAAIALKNQLGLVCDPVAGLVEVPCIKRNAAAIMCAISSADMALAGVKSVIPVDEVISAMREIGETIPQTLRETGTGGLATTPTGLALRQKILGV
ncbi:MAG: L-serine ammonia-lyase, iron-sulfur-dependent, subunit alpha [Treponema sp.]|jgi:L-serine dehydratase|nr:L-serine ammonia-lyase, iron-sulfur-dependent, subunit alpha [Treponema sp.]